MKDALGVARSLIPAGRALEVGKGGTVAGALSQPLAPIGKIQGTPDWWLATLPGQKGVRVREYIIDQTYNAAASDTQISFLDINEGESLIMLRYRFFALLPDTGGRTIPARPTDVLGLISWRLVVGSMDIMEYSYAKTSNGFTLVHDRLQEGYEPIPLFVHGKNRLSMRYTVITAPGFTINTVGFYTYGAIVPTKTLDEIAKRA